MVMDGVPTLPLVPGPHPPHTTTHQMLTPPLQDYTAWGRLTSSYPFHHLDAAAAAASSHFHDSLRADMSMSETTASQRLPQAHLGTLHFPSTHLQQQQQQQHHHQARRSPTNHIMAQGVPSTLASDLTLTQDPTTTMMAHANGEMLAAHLAAVQGNTNTGASLGHSLDGSPSWSSATMTQPMQLLEEYYMPPQQQQQQQHAQAQAQAQRQAQAEHQARVRHQQLSRGPPPPPDSSRAPHNSHSSIGGAPTPPTMAHPSHSQAQAHRYSLELRRQQEEQLHMLRQAQQRQQQQAVAERSRRKSAEEAYLQQLAAAYGHPSPHTHTQAAHGDHLYMAYTDGAGHPGLPGGGEEVYRLHGHPGMLEQGYRLVDGAPGPLDLMGVPGVPAQENSPVGMLRYESPLPLE